MRRSKTLWLIHKLKEYGHEEDIFVGIQVGLVIAGHKGPELHDDTCKIITSREYTNLFGSHFADHFSKMKEEAAKHQVYPVTKDECHG